MRLGFVAWDYGLKGCRIRVRDVGSARLVNPPVMNLQPAGDGYAP